MGIWGRRVVVVDDDAEALDIVGQALRARGADVVYVEQAGGALATILGVMPDVLLMDIAMPGLDGLSLIRKLRSLSPERGGRIPAASISAAPATAESVDRWRAAGFQSHIAKPFSSPLVVEVVESLAGRSVERRATALERKQWPTARDRRSELRVEISLGSGLRGVAGGNERILRELALADGGELG